MPWDELKPRTFTAREGAQRVGVEEVGKGGADSPAPQHQPSPN